MNRRQFLASTGAAGIAAATAAAATPVSASPASQPVLMKLGDQTAPTNDVHLKYLARYGVRNICGYPQIEGDRLYATVDELKRMVDMAAKYGISIDCTAPPFITSSYIDREKHPAIMLAQSPERDRDIEQLQTFIRNCAQAGIPTIKYDMSILGVLRTGRVPGRGDALYSQWKLSEAHPETPLTRAGVVNADAFWERITYFLDRVIPVANEYKIRMACHPQDPGVPPEGYQGVNRVLGTIDGLKKFITIQESPWHGLNFCQGTISEDLENPGTKSSTSSATSARAKKSSTCTSATSAAIATTSSRSSPTRATSISSKPSASTGKSAILTCSCPIMCRWLRTMPIPTACSPSPSATATFARSFSRSASRPDRRA